MAGAAIATVLGNALGTFILSISLQGILYVAVLVVLSVVFGYKGVLVSQACADATTAIVAVFIILRIMKKMFLRG